MSHIQRNSSDHHQPRKISRILLSSLQTIQRLIFMQIALFTPLLTLFLPFHSTAKERNNPAIDYNLESFLNYQNQNRIYPLDRDSIAGKYEEIFRDKDIGVLKDRESSDEWTYYFNSSNFPMTPFRNQPRLPFPPLSQWFESFEFTGDDIKGIAPNCSEAKFEIEDLLQIIDKPDTQSVMSVLEQLPAQSLQKFTLIYDSKSLQNKGASFMSPRVLRFNTDGSLAMTYTCEKGSPDFNTLEVMYFNKKDRAYNFVHTSFPLEPTKEAEILDRMGKKTVLNHVSCLGCHNGSDPRPNWAPYAHWPGVYGSDDDRMGTLKKRIFTWDRKEVKYQNKELTDLDFVRQEMQNFKKFKEEKVLGPNADPCYSSLPWANTDSVYSENYPYIGIHKQMNYNLRPNAHFTIAQSRRNAQRMARKFQEHPEWEKIKYGVALKGLRCEWPSEKEYFSNLSHPNYYDGKVKSETEASPILDRLTARSSALYEIGTHLGFYGSDWTLFFNKGGPKEIEERNYLTAQWKMADFTFSVLFRDLAEQDTDLVKYDIRVNRMSALFGEKFMCMDEVADKLWIPEDQYQPLCELLQNKQAQVDAANSPKQIPLPNMSDRETHAGAFPRDALQEVSVENGRFVIEQSCSSCHDGQVLSYNFADEDKLKAQVAFFGKKLIKAVEEKIGNEAECEMPYSMLGPCLNSTERASLLKYLTSLSDSI